MFEECCVQTQALSEAFSHFTGIVSRNHLIMTVTALQIVHGTCMHEHLLFSCPFPGLGKKAKMHSFIGYCWDRVNDHFSYLYIQKQIQNRNMAFWRANATPCFAR